MTLESSISTLHNVFGSEMTYTWHYSASSVLIIFSFSLPSKILSVLCIQYFWFQSRFLFPYLFLSSSLLVINFFFFLTLLNRILGSISQKLSNL